MSRQQQARDALRSQWDWLLADSLVAALAAAQEQADAEYLLVRLWPTLNPDDVVRLDRADPSFVHRGPPIPDAFYDCLSAEILPRAALVLSRLCPDNPHARGTKLSRLIGSEIDDRRAQIRDAAHVLFESEGNDHFSSAAAVLDRTIVLLSDRALDNLPALCVTNEPEARRILKVLTALSTPGGSLRKREDRLRGMRDGSTGSFPYILKYLNRGSRPSVPSFPLGLDVTLDGFRPEVEAKFPEAQHVRICLERYRDRTSVISRFINPEGPVDPSLAGRLAAAPSFAARPDSGLLVPKHLSLADGRRSAQIIADGIVCAVSLATLLESLLRQTAASLTPGAGPNARGWELLRRVAPAVPLRAATQQLLSTVFCRDFLSLRDAMSHGAFFASDPVQLKGVLAGLSQAMCELVRDLSDSGQAAQVFAAPRWDTGATLAASTRAAMIGQFEGNLNLAQLLVREEFWLRNLVAQPGQGRAWPRVWRVLQDYTPDKLFMGQAGFLLWVSGQEDYRRGRDDDTHHFAALFAGLVVLEDLFRAVYEVHGVRVLNVEAGDPDRARFELAMLDHRQGQLLDPASLGQVFGGLYDLAEFRQGLEAVKDVRDAVLHGKWAALSDPLHLYSHLVMKMIHTVAESAGLSEDPSQPDQAS